VLILAVLGAHLVLLSGPAQLVPITPAASAPRHQPGQRRAPQTLPPQTLRRLLRRSATPARCVGLHARGLNRRRQATRTPVVEGAVGASAKPTAHHRPQRAPTGAKRPAIPPQTGACPGTPLIRHPPDPDNDPWPHQLSPSAAPDRQ
jgi:hypothetical protein